MAIHMKLVQNLAKAGIPGVMGWVGWQQGLHRFSSLVSPPAAGRPVDEYQRLLHTVIVGGGPVRCFLLGA